MMADKELKTNTVYWAEITDKDLKDLLGKQLKAKFTGIFFRNIEEPKQKYFLSQLKIFREALEGEK